MVPLALLLLPREDFAPVWTKVAATIREHYYARVKRHDEMERLLAKYGPLANAAPDRKAFEGAVNAMAAEFHDSHFEFFSDEDQGYYMMDSLVSPRPTAMPQIGAWFRRAPDGYTVQMVLDGGAAERAGLRVGDLVTRVDGKPFAPVVPLAGAIGSSVTLAYRRNGAEGEARVNVTRSVGSQMFLDATLASRRTIERDGKRIGYVHLWTQAGEPYRKALEDAVAAAKDTDGFVLDLRAGFGGYVQGFAEAFKAYPKPLVVVIDHGSRSAKEIVSFNLQKAHRATLVGETTAGNVLGAMPARLNAWSFLEVPVVDFDFDGVRLEGRGVSPDVAVPAGVDPVERAVEILTAKHV